MTKKNPLDGFLSRTVDFTLEERSDGEGAGRRLSGYAAVFNADTRIRSWEGEFDERIAPGAFKKTLAERKPVMQFDHGRDSRFGSLPIGNFTDIREDERGLRVEGDLFDHAEPIRQAIASGAVSGMSFKFGVVREAWADKDGKEITSKRELQDLLWGDGRDVNGDQRGPLQRTITEVKLMEAGPVVFPAYAQTSVGVRSAAEMLDEEGLTEDDVMKYVGRGLPDETSAPDGERTSEDVTSEQPDGATDADESREESPDDAAQAGTSTGMSQAARERWMALNEL
ncbi:HK97 family phage prohead protease [Streptomyces sp. NPDC002754]